MRAQPFPIPHPMPMALSSGAGPGPAGAPFWADVESELAGANAPWAGWLSRRQLVLMVVAGVIEFAITLGVLGMAAHSSARLEEAKQAAAVTTVPLAGRTRQGLQVDTPAWAAPLRPSAS
jgi:hypothetical protein